MRFIVTVNVDHESGEGTVAVSHDRAVFNFYEDELVVITDYFSDNPQAYNYPLHYINWVNIQPVHLP